MKKLALLVGLLTLLSPTASFGQGVEKPYLTYITTSVKYLVARKSDKIVGNFQLPATSDASWNTGRMAVGTVNNTSSPPCPLNTSTNIQIAWPSSREMLIRKEVTLDPGVRNVRVYLTLDNGAQVFWNGTDISGGIQIFNGCAFNDNKSFWVPNDLLKYPIRTDEGKPVYLLAIRGNWQSSKNYLDFRVTGQLPYTITASAGANGSITPTTAYAFAGENVTFTATANEGFHVASFKVDGSAPTVISNQPTSTPPSSTYNLAVTGPHNIEATFDVNHYTLATFPADKVFIENVQLGSYPSTASHPYYVHNTTLQVRAEAPAGQYVSGWTIITSEGTSTSGGNPLSVTMDMDKTITANYADLPTVPTTYEVDKLGDYPETDSRYQGTLRWAVDQADNATPGLDIVKFMLPGDYELNSPLPAYDQLVYDGSGLSGPVVIKPSATFAASSLPPDGLMLSGVFFKWGYTPEASTIRGVTIQGFPGAGICIGSDGNFVQNCVVTGNQGDGICIMGGSRNTIGGRTEGTGNTIFDNAGNGVSVKRSQVVDGIIPAPPSRNEITGNSIFDNDKLGIDLIGINTETKKDIAGVTWNRFPDGVETNWSDYVNNGQNFPDLYFATAVPDDPSVPQESFVLGKLYGPPGKTYRVEIFANTETDGSGNGEGRSLIGTSDDAPGAITEAPAGYYTLEIPLGTVLRGGEVLSASATDELGNSSEFSTVIFAGVVTRKYGPMEAINPQYDGKYTNNTRWVVNTTFSGIPLHWPDGNGEFAIGSSFDKSVEAQTFKAKIPGAFAHWNAESAGNGVPLYYVEETGSGATDDWGGEPDGRNTLVFAEDPGSWTAKTKLSATNILALTRVRYKVTNGEITDADVIFNAEHHQFQNYAAAPAAGTANADWADFEAVLTHEVGHWGGLADFYDRGDPFYNLFMGDNPSAKTLTMYGIVRPEDIFHRDIFADDLAGIKFIYGEAPTGRADIVLLFDGSSFFVDPFGVNGFAAAKNAAYELIDKMRDGDQIAVAKLNGTTQVPLTKLTTTVTSTGTTTNRTDIKAAIEQFLLPDGADSRPIGSGLVYAKSLFAPTNAGAKGIILFSAGNENASPSALDPGVLNTISGVPVFTMGFSQSAFGQTLSGSLADATGGAYYFAADTTISEVVNQIWFNQVGLQLSGSAVFPSDAAISWQGGSSQKAISYQGSTTWQAISWQGGSSQKAISFQGRVDNGATSVQPAISWQGSKPAAAKVATPGDLPKFHLALVPPDVEWPDGWDYATQGDPPGTITPANYSIDFKGVTYVTGPTYAYYVISEEFANKNKQSGEWIPGNPHGIWTLVPAGANGTEATIPQYPIPVVTSLASNTDVIMDVALDKSTYSPNDVVTFRVTLTEGGQVQALHTAGGGPISGAAVTATIAIPGNPTPYTLSLTETGSGIYSGKFTGTSVGGTYEVTILSSGMAPGLASEFERKWEESFYVVPAYAKAVLFADNSVVLGDYSKITSGDVVVNRDAPDGALGFELSIHVGASTPAGYNLKADRIVVDAGATVSGELYFNELSDVAGVVRADQKHTPLSLPVGTTPDFETTDAGVSTALAVSVGSGKDGGTLPSGIHGALTLEPSSRLTLAAGNYHFKSIRMKTKSKLFVSGDSKIHVLSGVHADNESYVGLENSTSPTGTVFFVESTNLQSIAGEAVNFSPKSTINATVFAKNGTIVLNQESRATGSFLAKDIVIGQGVSLSFSSAFGALLRPAGEEGNEGTGTSRGTEGIPETYSLSQNYPNPFNPSTSIRYTLPAQGHVTLFVYDALGREVARLVDNVQPEGYHTVQWTGVNSSGSQVSTGVYFYRLQAGDFTQIRKMVLVK